jgi:hypothetical protein
MSRRWEALLACAVVALSVYAVGCESERAFVASEEDDRRLTAVSGVRTTEATQRDILARLARSLALALRDAATREALYQALRASPHREHKLHFSSVLRSTSGGHLLRGMGRADGRFTPAILALVDSAIDLELYMPVKAHQAQWTGGSNLIVASALRDHEIPVAYDLDGAPVALPSAEIPPPTPTLALVPVETDFTPPAGPRRLTSAPPPPQGVYMTSSYVSGDYEGFLMGDPEFELHVLARKTVDDQEASDLQCAGQHAVTAGGQKGNRSGYYVYDQNGSTWTGNVLLFGKAQHDSAQAIDSGAVYWLWEDDNNPCALVKQARVAQDYIADVAPVVAGGRNALQALISDVNYGSVMAAVAVLWRAKGLISQWQNDDIVGLFVRESDVGQDYIDATHVIVHPNGGSREIRGRVNLVIRE